MRWSWLLVLGACANSTVTDDPDAPGGGKADEWGSPVPGTAYVSASTVEALRASANPARTVAELTPPFVHTFPGDAIAAWEYLKPIGCLGFYGPLGPYGPLGRNGPVGFRWSNPSVSIENVGAAMEAYASWLELVARWYDGLAASGDLSWRMWKARLDAIVEQLHSWRFESKILSADGPLSAKGPLAPESWDGRAFMDLLGMPDAPATDLVPHLGPGGVLTALGPVGPLGVLGPIGPLGPTTPLITFQGYQADNDGNYLPGLNGCFRPADPTERTTNLCRTVLVPWKPQASECTQETANCRRYELYENYREDYAANLADNDTSFMVGGELEEGDEDAFAFRSHDAQYVTVLVSPEEKPLWETTALQGLMIAAGYVPGNPSYSRKLKYTPEAMETYPGAWSWFYRHETAFDDFDLAVEVLDRNGNVTSVAHSGSGGHDGMPDWVQLKVPAGARLRAKVSLYARRVGIAGNPEAFTLPAAKYRLFVTGSTKHAPAVSTSGAQFTPLRAP